VNSTQFLILYSAEDRQLGIIVLGKKKERSDYLILKSARVAWMSKAKVRNRRTGFSCKVCVMRTWRGQCSFQVGYSVHALSRPGAALLLHVLLHCISVIVILLLGWI